MIEIVHLYSFRNKTCAHHSGSNRDFQNKIFINKGEAGS